MNFELSDEQLEMVAGGSTGNDLFQGGAIDGSTNNGAALVHCVKQYGSINTATNGSWQGAQDSHNTTTQTWANLFSFNS